MSETAGPTTVPLGEAAPAGSRHAGRRCGLAVTADLLVAGTATGEVRAYDRPELTERWRVEARRGTSVVSVEPVAGGVAVGERGPTGTVRVYDAATGRTGWRYDTATDVGDPQRDSRFFQPFVVDLAGDGDRLYALSRRYERDGEDRSFESVVYAFGSDGTVVWTHAADASPTALDVDGERVAVAYNRCPGIHQHGLVVLEADTGAVRYRWDPEGDGQRRVGDVSLLEDGAAVASHGDYRGYRLGNGGRVRWRVDLGRPVTAGGETLYAYPNHVHATGEGVVFVTGNTYAVGSRETESLHPGEHTASGYGPDGGAVWSRSVGGFAGEIAADGPSLAVPGGQHFRTRDASAHGLSLFGVGTGARSSTATAGIVTAVAMEGGTVAAIEEPVSYHDEDRERGSHRLLVGSVGG